MASAGTTSLRANNRGRSAAPAPMAASPAARPARHAPPAQPAGAKPALPAPAAKPSKPRVELAWQPSHSPNLMGYNVYRAESPTGAKQLLNPTPIPETCYEDRDVQRGRTYYYAVRAVAADGSLSPPSNQTTALIPPASAARAAASGRRAAPTQGERHVHHATDLAAKR